MLGRAYWGGVYNGEIKALMIAHALTHFDRVIFRIGEDNRRSRRAVDPFDPSQFANRRRS
jgi:RimJ/RimL family protein N-acetyltransferase